MDEKKTPWERACEIIDVNSNSIRDADNLRVDIAAAIQDAVLEEREACADLAYKMYVDSENDASGLQIAEDIRARK